jgi:uncharacterized protein YjbJ (UPF0337 family)
MLTGDYSQTSGGANSMMGGTKEMVCRAHCPSHGFAQLTTAQAGDIVGSNSMKKDGKRQHAEVRFFYHLYPPLTTFLQGETEKKTAQTADAADGLYNQVAGKVINVIGSMMGDDAKKASWNCAILLLFTTRPRSSRTFHSTLLLSYFSRLCFPADLRFQARRKKSPVKPRKKPTSPFRVAVYSCTTA